MKYKCGRLKSDINDGKDEEYLKLGCNEIKIVKKVILVI